MPATNREIAEAFEKVADLLDINGDNPFRIRSYRNAAHTIRSLSRSLAAAVQGSEDLTQLPGIGKDLAGKIGELVETGSLKQLSELERQVAPELRELMKIPSLGPKRVQMIHQQLGIKTIAELKAAAEQERLRELKGFGEKTEQKILEDIARVEKSGAPQRMSLADVEEVAADMVEYLQGTVGAKRITPAGSYRRSRESIGDLDIVAVGSDSAGLMQRFVQYPGVERVISQGETRSTVVLHSGLQTDLRVVPEESYGAALQYFTGSKGHNVALRGRALKRKLKLNEYGVFKGDRRVAGRSEEEVYASVGLPYIEPELREDQGELEAAEQGRLPALIRLEDIRGDLQMHSTATDGKHSIAEMAEAARRKGYRYIAMTDHSKRVSMAKGLDEKRLARQIKEIDKLNAGFKDFRVLKSIEVDILADGSLDLSNDILKELDIVVCSVHYNQKLPRDQQTSRVLRAMDNPYFDILAHPTGRIIGKRESYEIDLERVMRAALERACFLELNADPNRLDLSAEYCRKAKEMGVKLAISTDAHSTTGLDNMRHGIAQARRAWLEAEDVLNTRSWRELKRILKRR